VATAERDLLERVLLATVEEQRRSRRWKIFFRFAWMVFLAAALLVWFRGAAGPALGGPGRHTALIDIRGLIDSEGEASAENIVESLQAAFLDPRTAGVIIRISSPGGSPVQSGIIHQEIRRLRAKHPDTPVHAVVEEVCASGGYYIAAAADKIFVDQASLIGSIGVLMDGFGFTDTLKKLGVERRLLTAGDNKAFLDSFSPMSDRQKTHAQQMLNEIHQQFIDAVKSGRGDRLKDDPDIFSGLVWTGARSIELGLADALGSLTQVAREVVQAEDIVDFSRHESLADRVVRRLGAQTAQAILGQLRSLSEGWSVR
jgi:protease-4